MAKARLTAGSAAARAMTSAPHAAPEAGQGLGERRTVEEHRESEALEIQNQTAEAAENVGDRRDGQRDDEEPESAADVVLRLSVPRITPRAGRRAGHEDLGGRPGRAGTNSVDQPRNLSTPGTRRGRKADGNRP